MALTSLYVYVDNSARFSKRSMQIIMKNMGHNLLILPKRVEPLDTYHCTEHQVLFSDEITTRLAQNVELGSRYYTSILQTREIVSGKTLLLTGIQPVSRADETAEVAFRSDWRTPIRCRRAVPAEVCASHEQTVSTDGTRAGSTVVGRSLPDGIPPPGF